jgi:diguanylate cyclase (GGDEF)-like protein
MVDIDHFKEFNDHYGHLAGDSCLKAVATALQDGMRRPHDLLARFGGEEFAVLLPNTGAAGAREVAEDLRQRIEVLHIPHERSRVAPVLTLSLGIKTLVPDDHGSITVLLSGADAALYAAKQRGRNRVGVAEEA